MTLHVSVEYFFNSTPKALLITPATVPCGFYVAAEWLGVSLTERTATIWWQEKAVTVRRGEKRKFRAFDVDIEAHYEGQGASRG